MIISVKIETYYCNSLPIYHKSSPILEHLWHTPFQLDQITYQEQNQIVGTKRYNKILSNLKHLMTEIAQKQNRQKFVPFNVILIFLYYAISLELIAWIKNLFPHIIKLI